MQIYALNDRGVVKRIYGKFKGSVTAKLAKYSIYQDHKGMEWLHIQVKKENIQYLLPFNHNLPWPEYMEFLSWK